MAAAEPSRANTRRENLYLPHSEMSAITERAKGLGIAPKGLIERVLYAQVLASIKEGAAQKADEGTAAESTDSGLWLEPTFSEGQQTLLGSIEGTVSHGKIALLEGSTGFGKSRVLLAGALRALSLGHSPVVIAAPTISILRGLAGEMLHIRDQAPELIPAGLQQSVQLGRGQFLDPWLLEDALKQHRAGVDEIGGLDEDALRSITDWLLCGGSALLDDPLFDSDEGVSTNYLLDHARLIAPDVDWSHFALRPGADPENPGEVAYQSQIEDTHEASDERAPRLIWTTFATVAIDLLSRRFSKGARRTLPAYQGLYMDEVHQLEQSVANVVGGEISPVGIKRRLNVHAPLLAKHRVVQKLVDQVFDAADSLSSVFTENRIGRGEQFIWLRLDQPESQPVQSALDQLQEACSALRKKIEKREPYKSKFKSLALDIEQIIDLLGRRKTFPILNIEFSPVRRYPTLRFGPSSVSSWLEQLWADLHHAVGLSATLYQKTINDWSVRYIASTLRVPGERLVSAPPQIAPWVLTTPTVFSPQRLSSDINRALLLPARHSDDESEEHEAEMAAYYDAQAEVIDHVAQTAMGGTLVLCTSYEAIEALADRLTPSIKSRLIHAGMRMSFHQQHTLFENHGKRPVWLATGSAWTGLNVSNPSVAPESDRLLTDLVIPRLPYKLGSVTAEIRAQKNPSLRSLEMGLQLRQGLGRLIRRPGVKHRRIWVLDARIVDPKRRRMAMPAAQILDTYPKHMDLSGAMHG